MKTQTKTSADIKIELLKMAAKAVGITLEDSLYLSPYECASTYYAGKTYHAWNPLDDDGDALRLAVALKMQVQTYSFGFDIGPSVDVLTWQDKIKGYSRTLAQVVVDEDYQTATRWARVRTAAKIGKAMS